MATITTTPITIVISCVRPIERPRNCTVAVLLTSSVSTSVPHSNWINARIRNASPIDISTSWRSPARLRRIGAHIVFSVRMPSAAVVTIANTIEIANGTPQVTFIRYAM